MSMNYYVCGMPYSSDVLAHHGILGQKWGIRRFQNEDGSLTEAGRERYYGSPRNIQKDLNRLEQEFAYAKGDEFRNNAKFDRVTKKMTNQYRRSTGKGDLFDGTEEDVNKRLNEALGNVKGLDKMLKAHGESAEAVFNAQKRQKEIESDVWRLLGNAAEQRYDVIIKDRAYQTYRDNGASFLYSYLFGLVGSIPYVAIKSYEMGGIDNTSIIANQYKVGDKGYGGSIIDKRKK